MADNANVSVLVVCRSSFAKFRNLLGRPSVLLVIITAILLLCIAATNTTYEIESIESYEFERSYEDHSELDVPVANTKTNQSNVPNLESDIDRLIDDIVSNLGKDGKVQEGSASGLKEKDQKLPPVDKGKKCGETNVAKTKATKTKIKPTTDKKAKRNERVKRRREKQASRREAETKADLTRRGLRKYEQLGRTDMLQPDRKCNKRLPEAIIIGVMKAGTEAFSTFLAINPQVAMSLNVRSTLFFVSHYARGLNWYRNQMTCATKDQTTIEKAPQYFPSSFAPQRIFNMNKNIKLILIVRDPIDRAVSHYLQVKNSHPGKIKNKSFEDMVFTPNGDVVVNNGFIALSRYSVILERWLAHFSRSQIFIVDGDEFKTDTIKVLAETENFLGIEHFITRDKFEYNEEKGFYCLKVEGSPACFGSGKGREHPPLSSANYRTLKAYFKPYNEDFYKMVGKRFNW